MTTTCDSCGTRNPEHHRFCCSCGAPLSEDHVPAADLDVIIQRRVDALIKRQVKSKDLVEAEALHFIEERVSAALDKGINLLKWNVKWFLVPAVFLVVMALGFWGIDFKNEINNIKTESREYVKEAESAAEKAETTAREAEATARGAWRAIDTIRAGVYQEMVSTRDQWESVRTDAEKAKSEVEANLGTIRKVESKLGEIDKTKESVATLRDKMETRIQESKIVSDEIRGKLETFTNVRYRVIIAYGGTYEDVRGVANRIYDKLASEGFSVRREDIIPLLVEEDKIVYHHELTFNVAKQIQRVLKNLGSDKATAFVAVRGFGFVAVKAKDTGIKRLAKIFPLKEEKVAEGRELEVEIHLQADEGEMISRLGERP